MIIKAFDFKVIPSVGFPQADVAAGGYAHVFVAPLFPDPEQEARDRLVSVGYEVQELRKAYETDEGRLSAFQPELVDELRTQGWAYFVVGFERES